MQFLSIKKLASMGLLIVASMGTCYAGDLASLFGQTNKDASDTPNGLTAGQKSKFLPVHEAFKVKAKQDGTKLIVDFGVTPSHYVYKDKIKLNLPSGVAMSDWQFSLSPVMVDDPDFGRVPVFKTSMQASTTLSATQVVNQSVQVGWQGCAEAGLCYPPQKTNVQINLTPTNTTAKDNSAKASVNQSNQEKSATTKDLKDTLQNDKSQKTKAQIDKNTTDNKHISEKPINSQANDKKSDKHSNDSKKIDELGADKPKADDENVSVYKQNATLNNLENSLEQDNTSQSNISQNSLTAQQATDSAVLIDTAGANYTLNHELTGVINDPFGFGKNPMLAIVLLFLAGVVVSFSACVYPMIPIVANIVAKSHNPTPVRGFLLTLGYALGMATSYGLLGAFVAWFGRSLGIVGYLQNPLILLGFALVFVLLALNMLGVLTIRLPMAIGGRLSKTAQSADHKLGSFGGSYMVGALSSLVVSPCVSAPLGGALFAISVIGSVPLGFASLFALGMGVSLPLLILGATQGHFMPKSGAWMEHIKHFGALMLLAVAIMLLNRVYLQSWMLVVWAGWFMLIGVFLYRLGRLPLQALGLMAGIWSALLLTGFAMNNDSIVSPLSKNIATTSKKAVTVTTLADLDAILVRHNKVLVDVTAQWCVECRIMERTLFANPPEHLKNWQVVKLDITETSEDSQQILARYDLFGPPSLLFYKEGKLIDKQIGEVKRDDFEKILANIP